MTNIATKEDFKKFVKTTQEKNWYKNPISFALARVQESQIGKKPLQAIFPYINFKENYGSACVFMDALEKQIDTSKSEFVHKIDSSFIDTCLELFSPFIEEAQGNAHKNIQTLLEIRKAIKKHSFKVVFLFEDAQIQSVESAYLKLNLLSLKKVKPREINLDGAFGILPNVAWSKNKAYDLDYLRENEIKLKTKDKFPYIDYVDKFPRYLSRIIPEDNVRILDTSRVRLGAYISGGTTIMPGASYINFNAGTLGSAMVEGRISSSAIVGAGSDVGGGASILGVLSGTDGNPISIGENCLLGANSTCGIPLGDGCIIDAGVSILAGTKVAISASEISKLQQINKNASFKEEMKSKDLASLNGLHFRQDSTNGKIVVFRSTREVKLNKDLH